jgi:hypothetical protein
VGGEALKWRWLNKFLIFVRVGSGFDVRDDFPCEPFFVATADAVGGLASVKP